MGAGNNCICLYVCGGCSGAVSLEGWGWELKPCLQSITRPGLDAGAVQKHVERIYDLVFISLFNMIFGALRAEKERK